MSLRVKICGLTNLEDAEFALEAGADYLGFIFYPPSPRGITPEQARVISDSLRAKYGEKIPTLVGVFVNESAADIQNSLDMAGLDLAQLSGEEGPDLLTALAGRGFKAVRPQTLDEAAANVQMFASLAPPIPEHPAILIDSYHPNLYGGTGETREIDLLRKISNLAPRIMLAGGLTPDNVGEIVRTVRPFGVDVASGVEASKGHKDLEKVREFIQQARAASLLEKDNDQ